MYKYIKAKELGYQEGVICAIEDKKNNIKKKLTKVDSMDIMSKLYDEGFIEGYNTHYKFIKNNLLKNNKI